MKKILEVLQYGETDFRFNTDIDPVKNPKVIPDILTGITFSMATRLWGGKMMTFGPGIAPPKSKS